MMPNLAVDDQGRVVCQKSRVSRTFDEDGSSMLIDLPAEETKMSLLGNLHLSKGQCGGVGGGGRGVGSGRSGRAGTRFSRVQPPLQARLAKR